MCTLSCNTQLKNFSKKKSRHEIIFTKDNFFTGETIFFKAPSTVDHGITNNAEILTEVTEKAIVKPIAKTGLVLLGFDNQLKIVLRMHRSNNCYLFYGMQVSTHHLLRPPLMTCRRSHNRSRTLEKTPFYSCRRCRPSSALLSAVGGLLWAVAAYRKRRRRSLRCCRRGPSTEEVTARTSEAMRRKVPARGWCIRGHWVMGTIHIGEGTRVQP